MAALEQRTAAVDLGEGCAACSRPLAAASPRTAGPRGGALPPLLLFPTGNAFHGACACAEARALAPPVAARISYLQQTLAQVTAAGRSFMVWQALPCSVLCPGLARPASPGVVFPAIACRPCVRARG